ncbi:hypothetical protein EG68_09853 [Paragonimus skrjabini miyazakii]|uniref:Histone-lysine N-methyltransferase SETMAR n=1 Tax=Paragonimus skrjabini miyazakii TaxID=59628 RepID=A0A8S9YAS7_9TREM|nr:hypothetical protein EG68_09853 [Paragonimus skrjabini miyazakii]
MTALLVVCKILLATIWKHSEVPSRHGFVIDTWSLHITKTFHWISYQIKSLAVIVKLCSCLRRSGVSYTDEGLLREFHRPIFECNSACSCALTCTNRIVQRYLSSSHGVTHSNFMPYRVAERPGVGRCLIAARHIDAGELVCVYLGEVVPYKEACRREQEQKLKYGHNYVLILKGFAGNSLVSQLCIDGDAPGPNGSKSDGRLVNHSCDPNLTIALVHVDSVIPYAAMFAHRPIPRDAELTYNYADCVPDAHIDLSTVQCRCCAPNCRGYLPRVV